MHYVVPIMTAEEELICFQFFGMMDLLVTLTYKK